MFLVTILVIGAIASTVAASLLLLATTSARNALTLQQGNQALMNAHSCMEYALYTLRQGGTYAGNETRTLENGTCRILSIGGTGIENRTICAEGTAGTTVRRVEAGVIELLPSIRISSWRQVPGFSLCGS